MTIEKKTTQKSSKIKFVSMMDLIPDECLARCMPAAMALDGDTLDVMSGFDVMYAVSVVMNQIDSIATLLATMAPTRDFDRRCVSELTVQATALMLADARYTAMNEPLDMTALRTQAIALRKQLEGDASMLTPRGILPARLLSNLSNKTGDLDIAGDLMALYAAFREEPEKWAGKTAVTEADLVGARTLARTLLMSMGERLAARTKATEALADERQRVFTLFNRGYGQVRRAVTFMRWVQGDADDFAPSLYEAHAPKHSAPADTAPSAPAPAPSAPVSAPVSAPSAVSHEPAASEASVTSSNPFSR